MESVQYTIRNIPPSADNIIRKLSAQTGKSLNQTVIDLLLLQIFGTTQLKSNDDFDWLFNKNTLDKSFDGAIESLSK